MPIVSDKKKLTKEEKEKFDELRNKTRALIVELGEIDTCLKLSYLLVL